jgi:hypothetical protein
MLGIVPSPREVTGKEGTSDVRDVGLPKDCPFGWDVMFELWGESGGRSDGKGGELSFDETGGLGDEGYTLSISPGRAGIGFSAPRGAYYGFVTLCELMKLHGPRVPCVEIKDGPRMPVRAVTDDISRGQISTLANFKSIIKRLSLFKINMYMPYIEDVLRFECEPAIGSYSDPVTGAEWREIVEYAKSYFVDVRPIFNTLGHWDRIGPLEEYRHVMLPVPEDAKRRVIAVLNPEHPEVRPLLSRLLGEVADVFGKGMLHVGGDEPVHLTKAHGTAKAGKLYTDHYRWVHGEVGKLGCTMAMYADMYATVWGKYAVGVEAAADLPRDVKMVYWSYDPNREYRGMAELMNMGFDTFISPATHNCARLSAEPLLAYRNSVNLEKVAAGRAAGIMMSNWGDGMDCTRELAWPGYAVAAEVGWAAELASYESVMRDFHRQFFGLDEGFEFARLEPLYRSDEHFGKTEFGEIRRILWREFWKDARRTPDESLKARAADGLAAVETAHGYLRGLSPRRNEESWACLEFAAKRTEFLARKLQVLEPGPYRTREQAKTAVSGIRELAGECRGLLEEAERRWFASNRQSQWKFVESKYLDLIDSFESLARYSEHCVHFEGGDKFLLKD